MHPIVVIAASEGGLEPLRRIVADLPTSCAAAVFIVLHIGKNRSVLPDLLSRDTRLPVNFATHGERWKPGCIYVAPPDQHMVLWDTLIRLNDGPKVHFTRPAANPLFFSAAQHHGKAVLGVVLSGGGSDGALGLRVVKEHGGLAILQAPGAAVNPEMPFAALLAGHPDMALSVPALGMVVRDFCRPRVAPNQHS